MGLLAARPGPDPGTSDYLRASGGGLLAILLSTMLGVGVGVLVDHISKFAIGQSATSIAGGTGGDVLPWGAACLVLLAWTAAFLLAAALVDRRRAIA